MDRDDPRVEALRFLKEHQSGVLATAGADGQPHASAIHYICDDAFNIHFLTHSDSRKARAIAANPRVAFTVGTQEVPQTVQMEGIAEEIQSDPDRDEKTGKLIETLSRASTYFPPLTKLGDSALVLVWIQPKWIRWADYATQPKGIEHVWKEFTPNA